MNRLFYAIFLLAGMPALVYQVVWQRVLTLYFGVDIYSTTVAVGAFMLGLGLGSLLGGRAADRLPRPALAYLACELSIGAFGIMSLPLFDRVGRTLAASPLAVIVPVKFGLLLAPALLMGMTLPLMCRIVADRSETIGDRLAVLYGANTLGAALGAFAASYWLIGVWGLDGAAYIAAAMNLLVAAMVLAATLLAAASARGGANPVQTGEAGGQRTARLKADVGTKPTDRAWPRGWLGGLSFLSGFVGLGLEIVWYRLLACILHGTVYVFGTILCVYLLGIACGSLAARRRIDSPDAVGRFARSQLAIAAYSLLFFGVIGYASWLPGLRHVIAASSYTGFHPMPDLIEGELSMVNVYSLVDIVFWTVAMIGLPTWMMGYGFPNLIRAGSRSLADLGHSVGRLYFANILGATAGTLTVGLLLLDAWGSERTLALLAGLGCLPALVWSFWTRAHARAPSQLWAATAAAVLVVVLAAFPPQGRLIRALHYADYPHDVVDYVAAREDRTGIVVLKNQRRVISFAEEEAAVGRYRLYIDGAAHGGLRDLESVELDEAAKFALAAHDRPRRVLCIGLGDGKLCAAAAAWPHVEELVIVELNAALRQVLDHTAQGRSLGRSPKVRFVVDDGRRWLLANESQRFDVILMWPLHAAHAHSGSLFSREFLSLCEDRLAENGVLFLRTVDAYSTARTVAETFAYVLRIGGHNYLASPGPLAVDAARFDATADEVARQIEADRTTILAATADAPPLTDFAPRTEYYVTYPWRRFLSTRRDIGKMIYVEPDRQRLRAAVVDRRQGE